MWPYRLNEINCTYYIGVENWWALKMQTQKKNHLKCSPCATLVVRTLAYRTSSYAHKKEQINEKNIQDVHVSTCLFNSYVRYYVKISVK